MKVSALTLIFGEHMYIIIARAGARRQRSHLMKPLKNIYIYAKVR